MDYPLDKYRFKEMTIKTGPNKGFKKVIALSTYAGKTVRGTAICSPLDTFDLQKGKELAAARCALKIANKRVARASTKFAQANDAFNTAIKHRDNMIDYYNDAVQRVMAEENKLNTLLKAM